MASEALQRVQDLRAAGDAEGLARLLFNGALSKKERRPLCLSEAEARAYSKLMAERKLADAQRRTERKQRAAYQHLSELRLQGDIYWIVVQARTGDHYYKAVITGAGLMPGVPRFELSAEESEAVRVREQRGPGWCLVELQSVRAGEYRSADWKWCIKLEGRRSWFVYCDGEPWGNWSGGEIGRGEVLPFASLTDAVVMIEEMEFRGLD